MALCLTACTLAGCSINPPLELAQLEPSGTRIHLAAVPFFPQTQYECGPAALAGVLGAAGVDTSPANLSPQVYLPGREGSLQVELLAATRRAERIPYPIAPTPQALLAQLTSGRPVLVFQNVGTPGYPLWHYAVLVGFDTGSNAFLLNSGTERALTLSAPQFLRTWNWGDRWAVVILRAGELPVEAEADRYLDAVASFEATAGTAAAIPAWRTAQEQWPEQPLPYLALGNDAYARGQLQQAEAQYHRGLQGSPQSPALNNNLASVMGELGCPRTGEARLQQVFAGLPEDSPWRATMTATLAELAALGGPDAQHCARPAPEH